MLLVFALDIPVDGEQCFIEVHTDVLKRTLRSTFAWRRLPVNTVQCQAHEGIIIGMLDAIRKEMDESDVGVVKSDVEERVVDGKRLKTQQFY